MQSVVGRTCLVVGVLLGCLAMPAGAGAVTFTGTSGSLSASADFEISGTNLVVTLSNAGGDVLVPADILTGVFWSGASGLTPTSAVVQNYGLPGGSTVVLGSGTVAVAGGNVGGEWAYAASIAGPGGADQGISSSGLGLFGAGNFGGPDLLGPPSGAVDGAQYGITSAADNAATGNPSILGETMIKSVVVLTLAGIAADFDLSQISNVSFQYGTALTEPNVSGVCTGLCGPPEPIAGVPLPGALPLFVSGLAGMGVIGWRRRRKAA